MISIPFCIFFASIALQFVLLIMIPLFSGLSISTVSQWSELTPDASGPQIFLLLLPILLIICSVCIWFFMFLRKKQWAMILRIILIFILLIIFFIICIVTMGMTYTHKMIPEFTEELVEKRIENELKNQCCYQNSGHDNVDYINNRNSSYYYIYGDCPYLSTGNIPYDPSLCIPHESTSVCVVTESFNETYLICDKTINDDISNFKFVFSTEIVAIILHILLLIDAISYYIRHFKNDIRNMACVENLVAFGCCEEQWDDLLNEELYLEPNENANQNVDNNKQQNNETPLEYNEEEQKESGVVMN